MTNENTKWKTGLANFFFLENLGNCREKIKKFENFRQFEHSPDILATFHGKNVDKMFFVVFLPTKRGLSLICYSSDCLLSTTNQRFFLSESSTLRLISGYSPKKALAIPLAIKKN